MLRSLLKKASFVYALPISDLFFLIYLEHKICEAMFAEVDKPMTTKLPHPATILF
jgi:hypothetical protein